MEPGNWKTSLRWDPSIWTIGLLHGSAAYITKEWKWAYSFGPLIIERWRYHNIGRENRTVVLRER
jgi:hypothetical protein